MKPILTFLAVIVILGLAPVVRAQGLNNVEAGVFVNDFRASQLNNNNFIGIGGRLSVGVKYFQIEGEVNYDFDRAFTETFTHSTTTVITTTVENSNVKVLHALFGPKVQMGGPVRVFATVKAGVDNFYLSGVPTTVSNFSSSIANLRNGDSHIALYPGVGFEAFLGPIGLRFDAGDEIYWANGARNNLRLTFGPQIRF